MKICNSCGDSLQKVPSLEVAVDGESDKFCFCLPCVKIGFHRLDSKKYKQPDEVKLLSALREFLVKQKVVHVA